MLEYDFITKQNKFVFEKIEEDIIKMYKKSGRIYNSDDLAEMYINIIDTDEYNIIKRIIVEENLKEDVYVFIRTEFNALNNYSTNVTSNNTKWFEEGAECWNAYKEYLSVDKNFNHSIINAIDISTSNMLNSFTDPKTEFETSEKGLVIGDVQSGKTANYMGLIAKACDAKFDYIVVLTGVVESLRVQTQERIEKEIIGRSIGQSFGVSKYFYNGVNPNAMMITKIDSDFKSGMLRDFTGEDNQKTKIFVSKKNKSILETLNEQFTFDSLEIRDKSILIIDDESDQASINTNSVQEDPTTINGLIRDLLSNFKNNYYIAYSATPAANLLIKKGQTNTDGKLDLFPTDFIIRIEPGKGYTGYDKYFSNENIVKIRNFDNDKDILRDAIMDFIVSSAAANILYENGKLKIKQASMIAHASHLIENQSSMSEQVKSIINNDIKAKLSLLDFSDIKNEFREFYDSKNIEFNYGISFEDVFEKILYNLDNNKILVKVLNSNFDDELKYDESNKNYIIVGGNKISRGLTIEGLLVTYFDRRSKLADTSLQMARWYGYREKYLDLTSLYISKETKEKFKEIELINQQIYNVVEELSASGLTPAEFSIEIEKSDLVEVTSPNKSRNANKSLRDYSLESPQITKLDNNLFYPLKDLVTQQFGPNEKYFEKSNLYIENVESQTIIDFLTSYFDINMNAGNDLTSSQRTNPLNWAKYTALKNKIEELINWTVVIVGKQQSEVKEDFFGKEINMMKRASKGDIEDSNVRSYKIITSPKDEALDLDEEILRDMELQDDRIKFRMKRKYQNGLLVIYPIYTEEGNNEKYKGISIMLSLPGTDDKQDLNINKYTNL